MNAVAYMWCDDENMIAEWCADLYLKYPDSDIIRNWITNEKTCVHLTTTKPKYIQDWLGFTKGLKHTMYSGNEWLGTKQVEAFGVLVSDDCCKILTHLL